MIAHTHSTITDRRRRRIARRRRHDDRPRPFGALGYLTNEPVIHGLIEIEKLVLVVLYDEPIGASRSALRLAGFTGTAVPWGVRWGGPDQSKFFKDLLLQPVPHGRGLRLDAACTELLQLGLQLDRQLEKNARCRWLRKRRHVRLPRLWAAFRPSDAAGLTGGGPELAATCRRSGESSSRLLKKAKRKQFGLVLYPLEWVSHRWQQAVAVFADLERFPKHQLFSLRHLPDDLQGCQGAAEFDFFQSRFRSHVQRRRSRRSKRHAPTVTVW